jgi:syntaxin 7
MSFADVERGYGVRSPQQPWGSTYQGSSYGYNRSSYDSRSEYDRLSQIVLTNIRQINQNVSTITKIVQTLGIPHKDTPELRAKLRESIEDTRKLAMDTNRVFKSINQLQELSADDKKRQSKLRDDFQTCLEHFQEVSKAAATRAADLQPPRAAPSRSSGPLSNPTPYYDDGDNDEHQGLIETQKRQQLMQLENERDFQSALIEEREQGIKQIETSIHEVNQIFIDLATLVNEQSPMIDNIENHIDSAVSNVSRGVVELRQAAEYQKSARTKMCCLVVIILAIVGVVVAVLALGLSLSLR